MKKGGDNSTTKPGDSLVKPKWTQDVPIYVRGMVLAGPNLFIVGPPDMIDEEKTFEQLTEKDPRVLELLGPTGSSFGWSRWGLVAGCQHGHRRNPEWRSFRFAAGLGWSGWCQRTIISFNT